MNRTYRIGETAFGIRTTSLAFQAWLERTLAAYEVQDEASPEYSIVIDGGDPDADRTGRRFHILYFGVGAVCRTMSIDVLGRALFAELESRLLHTREDSLFLHAGLVPINGSSVLVPAWLVAHMNGLGRRLPKAGVRLPIARWVAVDPKDGAVIPSERRLQVSPDALKGLIDVAPEGRSDERAEVTERWHPGAVLTSNFASNTIDAASRSIALHRLASESANLQVLGGAGLETLGRLVERARCYETGFGRPQQMLDALLMVGEHEREHG